MTRFVVAGLVVVSLSVASALTVAVPEASAGVLYLNSCSHLGDNGEDSDVDGSVWQGKAGGDYALYNRCPQGGSFQIIASVPPKRGENAQWATVTPPSIEIVHAVTPVNDVLTDRYLKSDGYQASFFWNGGSQAIVPENNCCGGMYYGAGINRWLGPSRYFGFQVTCTYSSPCNAPLGQLLDVNGIQLAAVDSTPPRLLALGWGNIWYQGSKWVRGAWPGSFAASDDSGVCAMRAVVDGQSMPGPSDLTPNQHSWTQCPTPVTMNLSLDTTRYADGPLSLTLSASDAVSPANVSSPSETLHVDNQPVDLALSGPTDAPSTAGVQYVSATATAGPSGVAGIACSEDGSPYRWHPGASAQIPVQGIGRHQVVCYAQNNAVDSSGAPASSPSESWTLSIREPTVFALGFDRIAHALRCRRVRERVRVPARWVTVRRHHKLVRIHRRVRVRIERVMRCQARSARRRVTVWKTVTRQGRRVRVKRTKTIRVVLLPHVVSQTRRRVGHGAGTTVSGWLGTAAGAALAGQPVAVLTAADNGLGRFRVAAVVTTRSDGSWSARLRPGPSRLVEAVYGGGAATEPASSAQVRLIVPAKVQLRIRPSRSHWAGTIKISGRVLGGYIPSGKLLRLRIGAEGVSGTVGIPDVARDGRFHTSWRFAAGSGTVRYWFSVSTLPEAAYPYAPASSRRVSVAVGPS